MPTIDDLLKDAEAKRKLDAERASAIRATLPTSIATPPPVANGPISQAAMKQPTAQEASDRASIVGMAGRFATGAKNAGNAALDIAAMPAVGVGNIYNQAIRPYNAFGAGIPAIPANLINSPTPFTDRANPLPTAPTSAGVPAAPAITAQPPDGTTTQSMLDNQNAGFQPQTIAAQPKRPQPGNMQPKQRGISAPIATPDAPILTDEQRAAMPAYVAYGDQGIQAGYNDGRKVTFDPFAGNQAGDPQVLPANAIQGYGAFQKASAAGAAPGNVEVIRGMNQTMNRKGIEGASPFDGGKGLAENQTAARMDTITAPFRSNATGYIDPKLLSAGDSVVRDATEPVRQAGETERNKATIAGGITREAMQQTGANARHDTSGQKMNEMNLGIIQGLASGDPVQIAQAQKQLEAIQKATGAKHEVKMRNIYNDMGQITGQEPVVVNLATGSIIGEQKPAAAITRDAGIDAVKRGAPKEEVNKRLVAAGLKPI